MNTLDIAWQSLRSAGRDLLDASSPDERKTARTEYAWALHTIKRIQLDESFRGIYAIRPAR